MKNLEVDSSCSIDAIKHSGIIKKIDNNFYYVSIVAQSACAACSVKGACNISDINEEIVEVPKVNQTTHTVGDKVNVVMQKSLGTRAVMLGYFLPFLLVLLTLIVTLNIFKSQGLAGLISLGVLVPYYMLLYFNKDRLKKTFTFKIE